MGDMRKLELMKYAVGIGGETRRKGPDGKTMYIELWKKCGANARNGPSLWQARSRSGKLLRAAALVRRCPW